VEKGTVYVGTDGKGSTISVATSTTKHVPVYDVTVTVKSRGSGTPKTIKIKKEFREWFDSQGHFVARPFQAMLSGNVELVAEAQREKVKGRGSGSEKKAGAKKVEPEIEESWEDKEKRMDEKWAALLKESSGDGAGSGEAEGSSTGTATPSGKGGKKRGKKAQI
jgi:signal peptidase complex subunit 2